MRDIRRRTRERVLRQRRRSGSSWRACAGGQHCRAVPPGRGSPRACITASWRSSWKPVRRGWRATPRARPPSGEVKDLRREMRDLKEALAEQMLENRLLGDRDRGWGSGARVDIRHPRSWRSSRLVERSHLPVRRTLDKLGIPATTFLPMVRSLPGLWPSWSRGSSRRVYGRVSNRSRTTSTARLWVPGPGRA